MMVVVVPSEAVWIIVVLFSLSISVSGWVGSTGEEAGEGDGDCGASSKERRDVFASEGIAYAGGSQDGVLA